MTGKQSVPAPPPAQALHIIAPGSNYASAHHADFLEKSWKLLPRAGRWTVATVDAAAGSVAIKTGLKNIGYAHFAQIFRNNQSVTADAIIVLGTDGTLTISNGATYHLTAGDVISWSVIGHQNA